MGHGHMLLFHVDWNCQLPGSLRTADRPTEYSNPVENGKADLAT